MTLHRSLAAVCALLLAGCMPCPYPATQPAPAAIPTALADSARLVEVRIVTLREGASGKFSPDVVRARRGDLLRFRMEDGDAAHNVSFIHFAGGESLVALPQDGPFLTEEGQSWQMRINLPPGRYEFGCLPHGVMGQSGTLIVEP